VQSFPRPPRTLADWLAWQQRAHPNPIDLGLARVAAVAGRMKLLPVRVPAVIVGGTNGKGSTATFIDALLRARGERVGLFTSPHLVRYNERIRIDGVDAGDDELCAAFARIESARGDVSLTFFEYNALAALELFRSRGVTCMVLEVGLGGRLDATNIVDADVAVVCSIGLDHTDWLGDTLEAIGGEKAGIFRDGQDVVLATADMPSVVRQRAARARTLQVGGEDFRWRIGTDGGWQFDVPAAPSRTRGPLSAPSLSGDIQYRNAATAIAALQALESRRGWQGLDAAKIDSALRGVVLPGRLQVIPGEVEWVLDVAHNVPAAGVLVQSLQARAAPARCYAVFGMLADKDAAGVAAQLDPIVDEWLLCGIDEVRGLTAQALRARMGGVRGTVREFDDVAGACTAARADATRGERVLVCGSFHVVGPALQWLGLY
jgi:dihydrofolate synthase/folylpolyglutamate synthase